MLYRTAVREVRDLLWQKDALEPILRQVAASYVLLQKPDVDRWRNAPAAAGRQYFSGTAEATLEGKIADMLKFAFTGGSWPDQSVGAGGRAAFLDSLADGSDSSKIPRKPTVAYAGPVGFPLDGLTFRSSAFSDPQGDGTFGAMKWRIARVTKLPKAAGSIALTDPFWKTEPVHLEIRPVWESAEFSPFLAEVTIPPAAVAEGATYRVRVRMMDTGGYWSHWSAPVEFTAGPPARPAPQVERLRITEIHYNPGTDPDLEFIELQDIGIEPVDLPDVRIAGGIEFAFEDGSVPTLGPGEFVVVVKDLAAFSRSRAVGGIRIAGEFAGSLDNGGERILLTYGEGQDILDFAYDDSWYPETDGGGRSLTIRDPTAPRASWVDPGRWFASSVDGGTPGRADPASPPLGGLVRPGDANLDGALDLGDPIQILFWLFLGDTTPLPCEGSSLAGGGNLAVLDADGTKTVDLNDPVFLLRYLFHGGPTHVLGEACLRVEGCPETCGR
jgi:hypothetical protein